MAGATATATMSSGDVAQLRVRFVTTTCTHIVPDSTLTVPATLGRYGLSEIVNALTQQSDATPYDFLIDGTFLRTDLSTYINDYKLSVESVITLEYVAALSAPSSLPSRPHPDWISSITASHVTYIVTASYDKNVRVFNNTSTVAISAGVGHTGAVKSVARIEDKDNDNSSSMMIVSGGKDRTVRLWKFVAGNTRLQAIGVGNAHEDSVDVVATCKGSSQLYCSGGWDKRIMIWQAPADSSINSGVADSAVVGKRQRTDNKGDTIDGEIDMAANDNDNDSKRSAIRSSSSISSSSGGRSQSPIGRMEGEHGHAGAVSALCWPNALTLYSGSWDHTIRQWDPLNPVSAVHTWNGSKVVTSLCHNSLTGTLASGHNDNIIRLWDGRSRDGEAMKLTLRSHRGWVSGVTWRPNDSHTLASASYDGTIKIWDIRSSIPLHTLTNVHGGEKTLAIDWNSNGNIWSGGADNKLAHHRWAQNTGTATTA